MVEHWIKNKLGETIGVIRAQSDGVQRIYRVNGTCLGEYRPSSNSTYTLSGQLVGSGNLLAMLLAG